MRGLIFSIKRYAIHDGPGIRISFFMKGCPLDCWWCHNPEGKTCGQTEVLRSDRIGDKEFNTMEKVGMEYSADGLVAIAERERVFMQHSGGGVTFTGGEPLMQDEFLVEALSEMKKAGFHTAVDTSGYASGNILRAVMKHTDIFLFDIKHLDNEAHIKYTGVSNELILSNLDLLLSEGSEVMIRVPVIPGVTANTEFMMKLSEYLGQRNTKSVREINLLPYHKTGSSKYRRFGIPDRMTGTDQISDGRISEFKEILKPLGIRIKTGG